MTVGTFARAIGTLRTAYYQAHGHWWLLLHQVNPEPRRRFGCMSLALVVNPSHWRILAITEQFFMEDDILISSDE